MALVRPRANPVACDRFGTPRYINTRSDNEDRHWGQDGEHGAHQAVWPTSSRLIPTVQVCSFPVFCRGSRKQQYALTYIWSKLHGVTELYTVKWVFCSLVACFIRNVSDRLVATQNPPSSAGRVEVDG